MNILLIIVTFCAVSLSIYRLQLSRGLLAKKGKAFVTHNFLIELMPDNNVRLRARGGTLTDRFKLIVPLQNLDRNQLLVGQRPRDKNLDAKQLKIYRVATIPNPNDPKARGVVLGDFALTPQAQEKFAKFGQQLYRTAG